MEVDANNSSSVTTADEQNKFIAETLWQLFQNNRQFNPTKKHVAVYIKNIFNFEGLDDPRNLLDLRARHGENFPLQELESKVRKAAYRKFAKDDRLQEFYGNYSADPSEFVFSFGDKGTIERIYKFALANENNNKFWSKFTRPSQNAVLVFDKECEESNINIELRKMLSNLDVEINQLTVNAFLDDDKVVACTIVCYKCNFRLKFRQQRHGYWNFYNLERHWNAKHTGSRQQTHRVRKANNSNANPSTVQHTSATSNEHTTESSAFSTNNASSSVSQTSNAPPLQTDFSTTLGLGSTLSDRESPTSTDTPTNVLPQNHRESPLCADATDNCLPQNLQHEESSEDSNVTQGVRVESNVTVDEDLSTFFERTRLKYAHRRKNTKKPEQPLNEITNSPKKKKQRGKGANVTLTI